MATLVNQFLCTGRGIREVERRLTTDNLTDSERVDLGAEHQRLMHLQQDQIVEAVNAGCSWETVRFSLVMHGQHSDREYGDQRPTPAEQLLAMFARHGPDRVIRAIDDFREALTAAIAEHGQEAVWRHLEQLAATENTGMAAAP